MIRVFWDITVCHWVSSSWHSEGSNIFWNIRHYTPSDTVWQARRLELTQKIVCTCRYHRRLLSYTPIFPSLKRQKLQHSSWQCCQKTKAHSNGCIKDNVQSGLMKCFCSRVSQTVISFNFTNALRIVSHIW